MASLFQGTPNQATSYVTSTTETPKWMQDAIYNQIQWSTNVAQAPYETYKGTMVAGRDPLQQRAYDATKANAGAWDPTYQESVQGMRAFTDRGADDLVGGSYLSPTNTQKAFGGNYLAPQTGQASWQQTQDYMNPFNTAVTDQIAKLGARNLNEVLLPGVSDSFVRAGQFGSSRMGEFGARALRDTQEAILGKQAEALQAGYGQALSAANTDLARQQSGFYQGLGAEQSDLSRQQTGFYQGVGAAQGDLSRQQSATGALTELARAGQGMRSADVAALDAAGQGAQTQAQREADAAYAQFVQQRDYPKQTLDWLNTQVRGMAPITPTAQTNQSTSTGQTYSPSPLSQIASGLALGKAVFS